MHELRLLLLVTCIYLALQAASGLTCHQCSDAWSNAQCLKEGILKECENNENVCITEIRRQAGSKRTRITKRCKEANACINNYWQNQGTSKSSQAALWRRQCLRPGGSNTTATVCRCCCVGELCNSGLYDACRTLPRTITKPRPARCLSIWGRPANGRQMCSRWNQPSSHCHFACNEGYTMHGQPDISCQIRSGNVARWTGAPPCCALPCPPHANVDLIIGFQSSVTYERDWDLMKQFVIELVKEFIRIAGSDTRVGLFTFKEKPDRFEVPLKRNYRRIDSIMEDLASLKSTRGKGASWYSPLYHVQKISFLPSSGNRPRVRDIFVLVVNGPSTDNDPAYDPSIPARQLRDNGVNILATGVAPHNPTARGMFMKKLKEITGADNKIFVSENGISSLIYKIPKLQEAICGHPCRR